MIEAVIGGFAYVFIILYAIVRAGKSGAEGPPNSDEIALEMVVPITIALAFVALLGYWVSDKIENDTQLALVFGTLFILSIGFSILQFMYSNIRQTKVA